MKTIKKILIFTFFLSNINFVKSQIEYFDTTYGKSKTGIVQTEIGSYSQIKAISNYPNNKILAVGYAVVENNTALVAARYSNEGTLDTSFGTNGVVVTPLNESSVGNAITYDATGKIVVTGYTIINNKKYLLICRYLSNGSLDLNFGVGGKVTHLIGSALVGNSIAIDNIGRILVAGTTIVSNKNNAYVIRYNSNGTLDTSFGAGGARTFILNQGLTGNSIAIDSSSRIIVGGSHQPNNVATNFMVMRVLPNGGLDQTFGPGGIAFTSIGQTSTVNSIYIDSQNKIVAGGYSGSPKQFTIVRYNSDGSRDKTFSTNLTGIQVTNIGTTSEINSIITNSDDKIIASGVSDNNFAVARYHYNGGLDSSFGQNGILVSEVGQNSKINSLAIELLQSKVIVSGSSGSDTQSHFTLARLNKNNSDFINIDEWTNNTIVNTKIPVISGTSSLANGQVEVYVNGNFFKSVNTNGVGTWNAGNTNVLPVGPNTIEVRLLNNGNTVVAQGVNVLVVDNFSEDSLFAYSVAPQFSTSQTYSPLPFAFINNNGTWSYQNSIFTCNKSGTYLIEYIANAGLTGNVSNLTSSIDVAAGVKINGVQYLGSQSQKSLSLTQNLTSNLNRSIIKQLNSGDTVSLNFAVKIVGSNSGFNAGVLSPANPIGSQPSYSLIISRID